MKRIKEEDLVTINGGASITSSLINSITKAYGYLLDLGRSLGSSIRRISSGNLCPTK